MIYCFYHKADLDGWASGAIVRYYHETLRSEFVKMCPINYGDEFPFNKISQNDLVYMCDFSLPIDQMDALNTITEQNFIWIDHHKGAIDTYDKSPRYLPILGLRDTRFSGCQLTWKYLFPKQNEPNFIKLLGLYDIWDHSGFYYNWDTIENFQYGFKSMAKDPKDGYGASFWESWFDFMGQGCSEEAVAIDRYIEYGFVIRSYVESRYQSILEDRSYMVDWEGYKCLVANSDPYIANFMTRSPQFEGCDLAINYSGNKDGTSWTVNLRTVKPEIDLSILAKKYDGGGHKSAAGFTWAKEELPWT